MSSGGRLIASCLAMLAAAVVMLGCGSGDPTSADIDPQTASDLTGQLDKIQAFLDDGNCDRAIGAVDTLREAVNAVSGSTGEQFTADALELVDNLETQVEDQCVPAEKPTPPTTEPIDTVPEETTDTVPEETTDTVPSETTETETTTDTATDTTTTQPPTNPPVNPGGGNPGGGPGGGIIPGGGKGKDRSSEGHGQNQSKDHGGGKRKERNR
jgi:hypothetical protein